MISVAKSLKCALVHLICTVYTKRCCQTANPWWPWTWIWRHDMKFFPWWRYSPAVTSAKVETQSFDGFVAKTNHHSTY